MNTGDFYRKMYAIFILSTFKEANVKFSSYLSGGNRVKFLIGGTIPDRLLYEKFLTRKKSFYSSILQILRKKH